MQLLVDTHTHLYLTEFREDIDTVINNAIKVGVRYFLLPAIDSTHTDAMHALEAAYPEKIFAMAGLHPCSVNDNVATELAHVQQLLKQHSYKAIGEIGLDHYWDTTYTTQQEQAFEQQMEWALTYNIPIVIHTRNAMQRTIDMVQPFARKGLQGIFHCFSGSYESAKQIIDMNFLLGIGGVVTYKNAGLGAVLAKIGIEPLVLETDAPYLTPVPFRGKRNEPAYLSYVVAAIAQHTQVSEAIVAKVTTANAMKIFKLPQ
ncbi:MAG: TatD family hydrolase [Chitinophagaceae bacterium]